MYQRSFFRISRGVSQDRSSQVSQDFLRKHFCFWKSIFLRNRVTGLAASSLIQHAQVHTSHQWSLKNITPWQMLRRTPARSATVARDTIGPPYLENWAAVGPVSGLRAAAQPSFWAGPRAAGRPKATGQTAGRPKATGGAPGGCRAAVETRAELSGELSRGVALSSLGKPWRRLTVPF